ncbi:hypothetical protein CDQ74_05330 [Campylobacter hyointestinalis subsp. hyointestinalis]|uniref:Uncharacterized protein n=1 Tax=Campylobacter hyointestinalis subsp. hyointestinalis TaxID=91352 RepID=A0A855NEE1_CAMHY|nr:hypothetical protein CDQ70_04770 [Campylobacter hyointestinalis subsp. hyointestinalis]PPB63224.1 hypothetical protein CDQ74_05330 [Campylobacter hyointestinalis subsp. hyointestinalis]PPB71580.1 hypothetical protein CDQ78_06265 [Campylobacter hyointestinalis subsp. hyointestinalis]
MFNFLFNFTEFLVLMLSKRKLYYYIVSSWLTISIFINIFFSIKISQNIGISIIFYFIMYCLKDSTNFKIYIKKNKLYMLDDFNCIFYYLYLYDLTRMNRKSKK